MSETTVIECNYCTKPAIQVVEDRPMCHRHTAIMAQRLRRRAMADALPKQSIENENRARSAYWGRGTRSGIKW